MRFETSKVRGWLIGDPHFGRDFSNGRPLNRRGDRERMQRAQFREELNTPDVEVIIMVGDLFDKPVVPLTVLLQVIQDVIEAAEARPEVTFIFMAGNHDLSRVLEQQGAWEVFKMAVGWLENVHVINEVFLWEDVACFPWDWTLTVKEQLKSVAETEGVEAIIGHFDMMSFGGSDDHLCPVEALQEAFGEDVVIYSGHYHEERDYEINGVTVHCTGSLQPYAHGEGDMYVTLTLEEALKRDDLADKVVRIRLQPGETLPDINCLQLTAQRVTEAGEVPDEIDIDAVASTTFNVEETLKAKFEANEVPDNVQTFIKEKLGALS